jgi:hypothetical protein
MEISELRLGNYVMDIDNDILPVTTDTFYWISECVRTEDDYKPIELTEDILFKCGFKLAIDENVFHHGKSWFVWSDSDFKKFIKVLGLKIKSEE